jgi:two-component system, chemotaxis family, chemotaxis protein CheY
MIVDDSAFMRQHCVALVQKLGHDTVEACDGREAVDLYQRAKPEAVLMDITMPDMDGLEALHEILTLDPDANIAMITAVDQQGSTLQALKEGARAVVAKPYESGKIKTTLDKLATKRRSA